MMSGLFNMKMRFSPFALLTCTFAIAACTNLPGTDGSSSSSSSMSSASSTGSVQAGVFTSEEYGFSVRLPADFEPIHPSETVPVLRQHRYIEDNEYKYKDEMPALGSWSATNVGISAEFGVSIDVFPLDKYSYDDIYRDEYFYDPSKDVWHAYSTNALFEPPIETIGGKKAYRFAFGDAGWFASTYAIPLPEKNVMLTLTFGSCAGCFNGGDLTNEEPQSVYDASAAEIEAQTEETLANVSFQ